MVWVRSLHPDVVQRFAHDTRLRKRIVDAVDAVVTASTVNYEDCFISSSTSFISATKVPYENKQTNDSIINGFCTTTQIPTDRCCRIVRLERVNADNLEIKVLGDIYKQLDVGGKVVEARVYYPSFRKYVPGDIIKFVNRSDLSEWFLVQITYKRIYNNFREMLRKEGVKDCLPSTTGGVDAAVKTYHSFRHGTYEELARQYRVVAYRFQRVRFDMYLADVLFDVSLM